MLHHANRASLATSRDPNFDYVTLLLHGDGTNGGQNNTFTDSSGNNYTLTRNGNPTQGTFSPYGTLWSNYFDGTGDFLTAPAGSAWAFGTGDFTVEAWVYLAPAANGRLATNRLAGGAAAGTWGFNLSTNTISFTEVVAGEPGPSASISSIENTWAHVCACRSGTTTRLFVNGIQVASATQTTNFNNTSYVLNICRNPNVSDLNGYVSNFRIVKGTAVYTANFTPPTEPLTAITNTQLLTCQSNRLIDNSSNSFTITRNGDVSVQRFSPFNPPGEYSTTIIGGSGYFDGTGDFLSVADAAALRFGTGNFTIQAWIYRSVAGVTHSIAGKGDGTLNTGWSFVVTNTNVLRFAYANSNLDTTTTIPAGVWTHVAVTREGTGTNQTKLFINGVQSAQGTVSTNFNQTNILYFGANRAVAGVFNGYLANIKYNVGTAETITVPTAPVTGGTILLNFTNASIIDNAMMNDLETVGNAQISTSVSRFGTGSLAFDGTGDWLLIPHSVDQFLSTGNFTIEFWVYLNVTGTAMAFVSKGTSTTGWSVNIPPTNVVNFAYDNGVVIASTGTLSSGVWTHIAVVREGTGSNQTKIYINGVNDGTGTVSSNFNQTNPMYIAANRVGAAPLNGYIDDLRITRGVARYTANFTPRNTPFPNM